MQSNDLFAKQTGFKQGFAVATDGGENAWLTHCPGVLAMARSNELIQPLVIFILLLGKHHAT